MLFRNARARGSGGTGGGGSVDPRFTATGADDLNILVITQP